VSAPRILTERLQRVAVLFEDDYLLVVSKPAGVAVHGGAGETKKTILEILTAAYSRPVELVLGHRLDRDTSGVLLLVKSQDLAKNVIGLWRVVEKTYWAVALGTIAKPLRVDRPLEDKDGRRRAAATRFEPLAQLDRIRPAATWVAAHLETGRTHQIRRHLAMAGHPVLLDDKHGDFAANKAWARAIRDAGGPRPKTMMLHARRLALPHPATGEPLVFEAPVPEIWPQLLSAAGHPVDAAGLVS
jgi:23S rRNA pseudouridine955/2504/2580 synthase